MAEPIGRSVVEFNEALPNRPLCILYLPDCDSSFRGRVSRHLRLSLLKEHEAPPALQLTEQLGCSQAQLGRELKREARS